MDDDHDEARAVLRLVDEPHFELDWAGDVDGDRHLDIVTNLSPKYSYYPRRLWLSSAAAAGQLVGLVAQYDGGD